MKEGLNSIWLDFPFGNVFLEKEVVMHLRTNITDELQKSVDDNLTVFRDTFIHLLELLVGLLLNLFLGFFFVAQEFFLISLEFRFEFLK